MTVFIGDLLAVRGPAGGKIKRRILVQFDTDDFSAPFLISDVELVLAGFVREIGDLLTVGRPGREALHDSRRVGEVAEVALFLGNGDDLAAGFKSGPDRVRRETRRGETVPDIHKSVPDLEHVSINGNGQRF